MSLSTIEIQQTEEQHTAAVRHRITRAETERIPGWLEQVMQAVGEAGQQPTGMPFLRTFSFDGDSMDIEVGCSVTAPFPGAGEVQASTLPGGAAAVVSYFGPYEGISEAYEAITAWCEEHGHEIVGPPWESYDTDPHEEPDPQRWRTDVYFPVRG